jgi:hypothetical protein
MFVFFVVDVDDDEDDDDDDDRDEDTGDRHAPDAYVTPHVCTTCLPRHAAQEGGAGGAGGAGAGGAGGASGVTASPYASLCTASHDASETSHVFRLQTHLSTSVSGSISPGMLRHLLQ